MHIKFQKFSRDLHSILDMFGGLPAGCSYPLRRRHLVCRPLAAARRHLCLLLLRAAAHRVPTLLGCQNGLRLVAHRKNRLLSKKKYKLSEENKRNRRTKCTLYPISIVLRAQTKKRVSNRLASCIQIWSPHSKIEKSSSF